MRDDLYLRRKLTLRAHGRRIVLVKKPVESMEHVLMKAFLWALYLPDYPALRVEIPIGDKYKPDVVMLDAGGRPVFWGEAGKVHLGKLESTFRRFRTTHFAFARWNEPLEPTVERLSPLRADARHTAPVDVLSFPADSAERFIGERGDLLVRPFEVLRTRLA